MIETLKLNVLINSATEENYTELHRDNYLDGEAPIYTLIVNKDKDLRDVVIMDAEQVMALLKMFHNKSFIKKVKEDFRNYYKEKSEIDEDLEV